MRHQDWILKVDYQDGTGDGHVLWRLGKDGDFTLKNPPVNDPFPWFSHQHGIEISSSDVLGTFDDGNTRCNNLGSTCHSRGQIYQLDEVNKTATLKVDADMGNYSFALGWVQTLQNGDYAFTSGFQLQSPPFLAQNEEFDPSGGTKTFVMQDQPEAAYRIYRMPSMYAGCCGD